jgi:hypothetical protein
MYNTPRKLVISKAQFEAQPHQGVLCRLLAFSDGSGEASTSLEKHMLNLTLLKIRVKSMFI